MSDWLKRLLLWLVIVGVLYIVEGFVDSEMFEGPRRPLPTDTARPWANVKRVEVPRGVTPDEALYEVLVEESEVTGDSIGTAFQVAPQTWITAAHVIDSCRGAWVRVQGRWLKASDMTKSEVADAAVITIAGPPMPPTVVLTDRLPVLDQEGFHYGFPRGEPGSVRTRLIGRGRIREAGRARAPVQQGWVWAELGRAPPTTGAVGGISGGPQVDRTGAVQGITVIQMERAGRLATTPIQLARDLLPAGFPRAESGGASIDRSDYGRHGDHIRDVGTVALVFCSVSGLTRPKG